MFHLQQKHDKTIFKNKTTFADIINLYTFDKKLRSIFIEYLERIEVCFRTRILNTYSVLYGFYWYVDNKHFHDRDSLTDEKMVVLDYQNQVISDIRRSFEHPKEQFLRAFKKNYTSETLPPENMAFETLSFAKVIKLYACLKDDSVKNSIAHAFTLPTGKILVNWLLFLNDVRNVCAHHSRLWNRKFTANKLLFPSRKKNKIEGNIPDLSNSNLYGAIIVINYLLASFNPTNTFTTKVEELIRQHDIDVRNLGFPDDWAQNAPWKI